MSTQNSWWSDSQVLGTLLGVREHHKDTLQTLPSEWAKQVEGAIARLDATAVACALAHLEKGYVQKHLDAWISVWVGARQKLLDVRQFETQCGWIIQKGALVATPSHLAVPAHMQVDHMQGASVDEKTQQWLQYFHDQSVAIFELLLGQCSGYWLLQPLHRGSRVLECTGKVTKRGQIKSNEKLLQIATRLVRQAHDPQMIKSIVIPWVDRLCEQQYVSAAQLQQILDTVMGAYGSESGLAKMVQSMVSLTDEKKALCLHSYLTLLMHYCPKERWSYWVQTVSKNAPKLPVLSGALLGTDAKMAQQHLPFQKQLWAQMRTVGLGIFEHVERLSYEASNGTQKSIQGWSKSAHMEWAGWMLKKNSHWAWLMQEHGSYIDALDQQQAFGVYLMGAELRDSLGLGNMGLGPGSTQVLLNALNDHNTVLSRGGAQEHYQADDHYASGLIVALMAAGNMSVAQLLFENVPTLRQRALEHMAQSVHWRTDNPKAPYGAKDLPWLTLFATAMSKNSAWVHQWMDPLEQLPQLPQGTPLHYCALWYVRALSNKRAERLRLVMARHPQWLHTYDQKGQTFMHVLVQSQKQRGFDERLAHECAQIEALILKKQLPQEPIGYDAQGVLIQSSSTMSKSIKML